eukprot:COSAG06_NODE_36579_length_445_cov_0.962428_1_plen_78_part_00
MLPPEQVASLAAGGLFHTRGRTAQSREWEGQQGYGVGDTVGLELDLRENGKETPFLRRFYIKCIILPRQARDKHREN